MPKPANPLIAVSKKLDALKAKSEKLAKEISDLSSLVAAETSKAQNPLPVAKKAVGKKAPAAGTTEPKKRGRPPKAAKAEATIAKSAGGRKVKGKK